MDGLVFPRAVHCAVAPAPSRAQLCAACWPAQMPARRRPHRSASALPPPRAGILTGVKRGMLSRAGASIRMQPGCLRLLKQAADAGIPT